LFLEHMTAETSSTNMPARNICNFFFYPVIQVGYIQLTFFTSACIHSFVTFPSIGRVNLPYCGLCISDLALLRVPGWRPQCCLRLWF